LIDLTSKPKKKTNQEIQLEQLQDEIFHLNEKEEYKSVREFITELLTIEQDPQKNQQYKQEARADQTDQQLLEIGPQSD
jgi:hypothetical protein